MNDLFLGLDASTQAIKASLLSSTLNVISEVAVNFDADLPKYGTSGGVLHGEKGVGEVYSPVMMIVEAMDILCEKIKKAGWDTKKIRGVSAAGQQHASVYWSKESSSVLANIDSHKQLVDQLESAFSRPVVPNWQDSSTTAECRALEAAFGGAEELAIATGSKAHERFTAAQIMRFKRLQPEVYDKTDRISLCSSFITTLLSLDGEVKGIDESDACGMNLWQMDTAERGWHQTVLEAIAGRDGAEELKRKLGKVEVDAGKVVGKIGKWFVERYGFDPDCCVFPGTGDNPATFLSLTLRPSEGLVSLGTSDVVLVSTSTYNPHPEYHAFFHPALNAPQTYPEGENAAIRPRYFNMLVYKNGSLARQHVRDKYFDKDWDKFNAAVEELRPKTNADLPNSTAFWWLLPDIIPDNASGVHKYTGKREQNEILDAAAAQKVDAFPDIRQEALAILESQLLNYRSRSSAILDDSKEPSSKPATPAISAPLPRLSRVYATGGASANKTILSLMADVLSAPVCKNVEYNPESREWNAANWNSCSVGVAYKARWGWERQKDGGKRNDIGFDDFIRECREARRKARGVEGDESEDLQEDGISTVASPGEGRGAYERSVSWWQALEDRALENE